MKQALVYLIISGHYLPLYDWSIELKPKVNGAFNRKLSIIQEVIKFQITRQMNWW
jgi:hypothetical protein